MERRRLQPPPQPPGLEETIAAALQARDISADKLGALIAETRTAIGQACTAAEAARARAYDPTVLDPTARQTMQDFDHAARRLRLALPRLETCHIRRVNAETYNAWAAEFEQVKAKHTAAASRLREVYTNLEHQLVAALTTARQVDVEVRRVLDAKPVDLPQANGDGRRLLTVECAARHLDGVDAAHSLMNMKIPTFADASRFSWPPPTPPILPQDVMPVLRGPSADWHRDIAERDAERRRDAQRLAEYHNRMAREKEERDAAQARAERQRMRNGGAQ